MEFGYTDEQLEIERAVTAICKRFDADYWRTKDRDGGFPLDFHAAFAQAGWLGIAMPVEVGGAGLGITEWLITASVSQFVWYDRGHYARVENAWAYALVPVLTSLVLAFLLPKNPSEIDGKGRRGLQLLLLFGPIFGYVPLIVHHDASGLTGAAGFLVLWSIIGWTALRLGRVDLFNLATAFLGMRLLGIYFELFGGLLNTGIGLLTGGLLTLLLAWLWVRLRRAKKQPPLEPLPIVKPATEDKHE